MNIRPLAVRDNLPALSFSHEYDEDDKKYLNVAYVVVDNNDKPLISHGMSYEECKEIMDYRYVALADEVIFNASYDPSEDVIDCLEINKRSDGGEDHIQLMADGSVRVKTYSYEELHRYDDIPGDDIPF